MDQASQTFGGGCLCGAIKYTISKSPITSIICLCTQCQTIAGGFGVGSDIVPKDALTVNEGLESLVDFVIPGSTKAVLRQFCKTCGTHLFAAKPEYPVTAVHAGTLNEPARFHPQVAIWCQSKRPYHRLPDDLLQFEQYPPGSM